MSEDGMLSPRKRGLIHFNPKYTHSNADESADATEKSKHAASKDNSGFTKPRKYFDSADFFMREELKNLNQQTRQEDEQSKKQSEGSSLASECQTCSSNSSNGSSSDGMNKNTVPLILLRRSKTSAMINSSDGTDTDPESLPTTVEVLKGVSKREIPPPRSSSTGITESHDDTRRSVTVSSDAPAPENSENSTQYQRTPEEVRTLLIPRLTIQHVPDDSSLAGAAAIVSPTKVVAPSKLSS